MLQNKNNNNNNNFNNNTENEEGFVKVSLVNQSVFIDNSDKICVNFVFNLV